MNNFSSGQVGGSGHNRTTLEQVAVSELRRRAGDPRTFSDRDIELAMAAMAQLPMGAPPPVFANQTHEILVGGLFVEAARRLGLKTITVIRHEGLTELEEKHYSVAINQLLSKGDWDSFALGDWVAEFEASIDDFSQATIGFANGELDKVLGIPGLIGGMEDEDRLPPLGATPVSSVGVIWQAGPHRVMAGSATNEKDMKLLMDGAIADAAVTDPPFGCKIVGFVSRKGKHRDFVEGAGDKSSEELAAFFLNFVTLVAGYLRKGALFYGFIDWRSMDLFQAACTKVFGPIFQMCCWVKSRGGQGGMYRSRHELVLVFKLAGAPHVNAIQMGRHGRNRTNVWEYPSAASSRSGREGDMLKEHPTPKPVEMIADAILDCTQPGDRVIDCFLGSGTTLVAADRTRRTCYGMELDPLYVDVAIRRWQNWSGQSAINVATGKTFAETEEGLVIQIGAEGQGND